MVLPEARFGDVPRDLVEEIESVVDEKQLESLVRSAPRGSPSAAGELPAITNVTSPLLPCTPFMLPSIPKLVSGTFLYCSIRRIDVILIPAFVTPVQCVVSAHIAIKVLVLDLVPGFPALRYDRGRFVPTIRPAKICPWFVHGLPFGECGGY